LGEENARVPFSLGRLMAGGTWSLFPTCHPAPREKLGPHRLANLRLPELGDAFSANQRATKSRFTPWSLLDSLV
jgi:hypothetical protein